MDPTVDATKLSSSPDPATGTTLPPVGDCCVFPSGPDEKLYVDYLEDLKLNGPYDITSFFGKRIHNGYCLIPEGELSNPKLERIFSLAVEEHNKHCRTHGAGNLRLVKALKAVYRITTYGATYLITLEAKDRDDISNRYQAAINVCEFGCMRLESFRLPDVEAHAVNVLKNRVGKLTDDEKKMIVNFRVAKSQKQKEIDAYLKSHTRLRRSNRFNLVGACGGVYLDEVVCGHWRHFVFDYVNRKMVTLPFHLDERFGAYDLTRNMGFSTAWEPLKCMENSNSRVASPPGERASVILKKLENSTTKKLKVYREKRTTPVCASGKKIEEILGCRHFLTRNGSYMSFLVKWRGKHGSRLSWISSSEKERLDQTP